MKRLIKNADSLFLTIVMLLGAMLGVAVFKGTNTQKQYDLYKHQTDSLFAVTQRAHEAQLAEGARLRDSLQDRNADLVRDYLRLRENEQSLVRQLKNANREKYQTLSAKEKQAEMIKRARE